MSFSTVNPATGELLKSYAYHSLNEAQAKLESLDLGFAKWQMTGVPERQNFLQQLQWVMRENKNQLAEQMHLEMGKSLQEAQAEVEKSIFAVEYYQKNAIEYLTPGKIIDGSLKAQLRLEGLGIILAIMPWNFPLWQFIRCAIPAFLVGNTILLKHSDITAGLAEIIVSLMQKALNNLGEKFHIVENLRIEHSHSEALISDPRVKGVSFTGSIRGGKQVAELAGRYLKKAVMELGGSDPYFVLADADIEKATKACAESRLINTGQSCVAAKRFFVHESLMESFIAGMRQVFENSILAPLAHQRFQQQLQSQVQGFKDNIIYQGSKTSEKGAYFPATILRMNSKSAQLWDQEFFGPVACVWSFTDENQAVIQANNSIFGLGSAIFSKNLRAAEQLSHMLQTGMVAFNDMLKSDPRLPFGGVKDSGFGRELSQQGIYEFANLKTLIGI